jgi:hypothetical protein
VFDDPQTVSKYYAELGQHFASNQEYATAERLYIQAGMYKEAIDMYNQAGKFSGWSEGVTHAQLIHTCSNRSAICIIIVSASCLLFVIFWVTAHEVSPVYYYYYYYYILLYINMWIIYFYML